MVIVHHREYTKCQPTVHSKIVNCMLCELHLNLKKKKQHYEKNTMPCVVYSWQVLHFWGGGELTRPGQDILIQGLHWGSHRCIANSGSYFFSLPPSIPLCQSTFHQPQFYMEAQYEMGLFRIDGGAQNPAHSVPPKNPRNAGMMNTDLQHGGTISLSLRIIFRI